MTPWPYTHTEPVGPGRRLLVKLKGPWLFDSVEVLPVCGGIEQRVQIGDFEESGRGLGIDGAVQLTQAIDALYTTALVFPAALMAPARQRWLIIGGGDGATAREALRFRDTTAVQLVDISPMVIQRTQEYIPSFWDGCQHDPRLTLTLCDAWDVLQHLAARGEQVDILVYDLTDPGNEAWMPVLESSANRLYTTEAFDLAARCLRPDGLFVAQTQELSLITHATHQRLRQRIQHAFRHTCSYRTHIDPFGCCESYVLASNQPGPWHPAQLSSVEERLTQLYTGEWQAVYSAAWHAQLFTLPPALQRLLG